MIRPPALRSDEIQDKEARATIPDAIPGLTRSARDEP